MKNKNCTVYKTANFIGKRWTIVILLELYKISSSSDDNVVGFLELKRSVSGITSRVLSMRLKELEKEKLILREKIDESNVQRSYYSLSESGKEFVDIIFHIKSWALKWKFKNKVCEKTECVNCF
jgi:DNA-binding HxlR family transcriptional regulator